MGSLASNITEAANLLSACFDKADIPPSSVTVYNPEMNECVNCFTSFPTRDEMLKHWKKVHCRLTCDLCEKTFANKRNLLRHKESVHVAAEDVKYDPCKMCGQLVKPEYMYMHIKRRHRDLPKKYKCELCSKLFSTKSILKNHVATFHSTETAKCDACNKLFKNSVGLHTHMKMYHMGKLKKRMCDICGRKVTALKTHIRNVHTNTPSPCDICHKPFPNPHRLERHKLQVHSTYDQCVCDICGRSFKLQSVLKIHMRTIHNEERNYKCYICDKTFKLKQILTTHQRVHSGQQPYSCGTCGKRFKWRQPFSNHVSKCKGLFNDLNDSIRIADGNSL